jgi:alpha-D-ribose 1-methylphosphonate 5-triphosphate diphosphatase PhnM
MSNGQSATGTRDEHFDLVSVLYHVLQAAETYQQYIDDARSAGDDELAGFFEEVQEQDRRRGERAKELLNARLSSRR